MVCTDDVASFLFWYHYRWFQVTIGKQLSISFADGICHDIIFVPLQLGFHLKIGFFNFYLSGAFEYWSWVCGAAWCSDISYGESGNEERKKFVQPQNFSVPPGEEHSEHMRNGGNAAVTLNDQILTSKHVAPDVIVGTQSLRLVTYHSVTRYKCPNLQFLLISLLRFL